MSKERNKNGSKIFNDPIHGRIELSSEIVSLVDTMEFQRLRNLKQLGFTNYVFHGGVHTRFEHSIGVCYIAGEWARHLRRTNPEITDEDILLVQIAGLVHDIGHGPFSHSFERLVGILRPGSRWRHEDMTVKIIKRIVPAKFVDEVVDIIEGNKLHSKQYLAHIINNTVNGLDADKLDYFIRDSQCTSFAIGCDWKRIVYESKIDNDQIVFPRKLYGDIENLYRTRYRLYSEVYNHKTVIKVEDLMLRAMVLADHYIGISESIDDVDKFLLLTDDIVGQMERCGIDEITEIIKSVKTRKLNWSNPENRTDYKADYKANYNMGIDNVKFVD
jgi:deoxynucleoside triphosphate triphosphohydrolase SAMHD1